MAVPRSDFSWTFSHDRPFISRLPTLRKTAIAAGASFSGRPAVIKSGRPSPSRSAQMPAYVSIRSTSTPEATSTNALPAWFRKSRVFA
jgi:hypothetical protein